jgi:hypothetical protein
MGMLLKNGNHLPDFPNRQQGSNVDSAKNNQRSKGQTGNVVLNNNTLDLIIASINENEDSFYKTKRHMIEKKYDTSGVLRRFGIYKMPSKSKYGYLLN